MHRSPIIELKSAALEISTSLSLLKQAAREEILLLSAPGSVTSLDAVAAPNIEPR
jgi:hypothetical protein